MSHYAAFGDNERQFIKRHVNLDLAPESCICKAHQTEAKRMWADPCYVPKWNSNSSQPRMKQNMCIFPGCKEVDKLKSPRFDSTENIELAIGIKSTPEKPLLLCIQHYSGLYHQLTTKPCASCGVTPKQGTCFTRHSPDAAMVNEILSELSENEIHLTDSDNICNACYRAQFAMLKSKNVTDTNSSSELIGLTIEDEDTDDVTKAILHTVLYVANEIMHERAVLLPRASQVFLTEYTKDSPTDQTVHILEVMDGTVKYTSQWLLQHIIIHLQPFIHYKCVHRKFGTILYRKGGDVLTSLSWALGRAQSKDMDSVYVSTSPSQPSNKGSILREASNILNGLIHAEIAKQNSDEIENPEMNIDKQVNAVDKDLWAFLEVATMNSYDDGKSGSKERNAHVKKLRRFFCLCILMYCTNSKPTKLHVRLADVIEMCGGSRNLIKIFNQLGVVASADTHDRLHNREREKEVYMGFTPRKCFLGSKCRQH